MPNKFIPHFLRNLSIPRSSEGYLTTLNEADRPIAVFSDFDGTIFLQDSGHILFDKYGLGKERREEIDRSIGKTHTFREASKIMWRSLDVTLERAKEELRENLTIDPDFISFFDYLQARNVSFTIISAGIKPLLRCALDSFVGIERSSKIEIIANGVSVTRDGKWIPIWLHDSPLGIDKSLALHNWIDEHTDDPRRALPKLVFIGDGISDLAATKEADILFARSELALEKYCIQQMIPYIPYLRFKDVQQDIKFLLKNNHYHDREATFEYRRRRVRQLTEKVAASHSFGSPGASFEPPSGRPQTPPGAPAVMRQPLIRKFSTGA